jgi:serine/threonine protein kinase
MKELSHLDLTASKQKQTTYHAMLQKQTTQNIANPLQTIAFDELSITKLLGEGSFGAVYLGKWHTTEVAIKKLRDVNLPEAALKAFKKEAEILGKLNSPYVVRFFGISHENMQYFIVMEYCSSSTLYNRLHAMNYIDWPQRWEWGQEIAQGVDYLHKNQIIHRDLAARNILLDDKNHAKIGDFGLSETKNYYANSSTGGNQKNTLAFAWTAPERLNASVQSSDITDIYSFGIVLWEIANRENPLSNKELQGLDPFAKIFKVIHGYRDPIAQDTPKVFAEVIEACRDQDPTKRPTAQQIVEKFKQNAPVSSAPSVSGSIAIVEKLRQSEIEIEQLRLTIRSMEQKNIEEVRSYSNKITEAEYKNKQLEQENLLLKQEITNLKLLIKKQEEPRKFTSDSNPVDFSGSFFSGSKVVSQQLNREERKRQDKFIEEILKGNIKEVKKLHQKGAFLTELHTVEQLCPLVAAVYSGNKETLNYIEAQLGDNAGYYWRFIDKEEAKKRISMRVAMPETRPKSSTIGWLEQWYRKNEKQSWCKKYNESVLKKENCDRWTTTVGFSGNLVRHANNPTWKPLLGETTAMTPHQNAAKSAFEYGRLLHWPSADTHDKVVGGIIASLMEPVNQFNQYVEGRIAEHNKMEMKL